MFNDVWPVCKWFTDYSDLEGGGGGGGTSRAIAMSLQCAQYIEVWGWKVYKFQFYSYTVMYIHYSQKETP